jgi:hypothetical protein
VNHWVLGEPAASVVRSAEENSDDPQINDEVGFIIETGNILEPDAKTSDQV